MAGRRRGAVALLGCLALGALGVTPGEAALLAQYQLEEAPTNGASLADSSGNGNGATLTSTTASSVAGVVGNGINFGSDGYASTVAAIAPSGAGERTIDTFFNPLSNGGPQGQNAIFGYGNNTAGEYFQLTYENGASQGTGADGLFLRHWGGWIQFGSGLGLMDAWHHLAVRVNPGATDFNDVDVFLDGTALSVTAVSNASALSLGIATAETNLVIGASIANPLATRFNGSIDEFRIHDNALSNGEIAAQAAIPEPSAALLGALGLLALVRRKR